MKFEYASPAQRQFFESGPEHTLFLSGYGGGKSVIGVMKLIYLLDKYPGSKGAIVRRTFSQLQKTTGATLRQWLPAALVKRMNEQQGIIELMNGSTIYMLYLDSPDSLNVLRGLEINFAFVDQVEELSEEAWDLLDTRCGRWSGASRRDGWPDDWKHRDASGRPLPPKFLFAAANSPGYDSWVYRRFSPDAPDRDRWVGEGYKVIVASSRDNKFLGEANLKTLLSKGEEFARRYVDAIDWGVKEGLIVEVSPLSLINPDTNPGLIEKIRSSMKIHRSLDHGETAPTCCIWWATDYEGNLYAYREYYRPNALVSQHRQAIFELSKRDAVLRTEGVLPKYYSQLADPSIFAKSRGRTVNEGPRWSVGDEYTDSSVMDRETAISWTPADNNEEATRSRMKEYLRVDPNHPHPITREPGSPRLFFIMKTDAYPDGMEEVVRDIRSQRRVEIGMGPDGKKLFSEDRDEKVRDHGWDSAKYFVQSRPSLGVAPPMPKKKPGWISVQDYDAAQKQSSQMDKTEAIRRKGYGR